MKALIERLEESRLVSSDMYGATTAMKGLESVVQRIDKRVKREVYRNAYVGPANVGLDFGYTTVTVGGDITNNPKDVTDDPELSDPLSVDMKRVKIIEEELTKFARNNDCRLSTDGQGTFYFVSTKH